MGQPTSVSSKSSVSLCEFYELKRTAYEWKLEKSFFAHVNRNKGLTAHILSRLLS